MIIPLTTTLFETVWICSLVALSIIVITWEIFRRKPYIKNVRKGVEF